MIMFCRHPPIFVIACKTSVLSDTRDGSALCCCVTVCTMLLCVFVCYFVLVCHTVSVSVYSVLCCVVLCDVLFQYTAWLGVCGGYTQTGTNRYIATPPPISCPALALCHSVRA